MTVLRLAAAACVTALALHAGWQASTALATTPPSDDATGPDATEEQPAPLVRGFRSAGFGADESGVRRAIFEDFGLAGGEVVRSRNDLEQTTVLTIRVPELLPDAGPATVTYVLGSAGTLIQVTILWGLDSSGADTDSLQTTARILIDFFDDQGFQSQVGPEPLVFVEGTNLLYYARGADGGGLALSALPRQAAAGEDPSLPPVLRLAYAADLANPDVFRAPAIRP